jgi:glyoxylase-like metal-dependent hydrolase (beta-lactamase superfamily II)
MNNISRRFISCMAHPSSEGRLLIGDTRSALIDCGMEFCARETVHSIKEALGGEPPDVLIITHTHYDHIGALPSIRKAFPDIKLLTTAAGATVLEKETPRRVIRELSAVAAAENSCVFDAGGYDTGAFYADGLVEEGASVPLGGLTVRIIETPGHTRDSLSFFVPELGLLFACETPGVLMPDGSVYPCYLTGFADTISSIEKLKAQPYTALALAHRGVVEEDGYFDKALAANNECRDFILKMSRKNLPEGEMLELFYQRYGSDILLTYQPKDAFMANARATVACTLREFTQTAR